MRRGEFIKKKSHKESNNLNRHSNIKYLCKESGAWCAEIAQQMEVPVIQA